MRAIILESERLILQPLSKKHLSNNYVSWLNDPLVSQYLESGGDYTIEKLRNFIEMNVKKDIFFWAIHIKDSNKHIGNIKIDPIDEILNSGEYGIMMGEKTEWGKGYAKEASLLVIKYCFQNLSLSQITLGVVENNVNAIGLYRKMGFVEINGKKNKLQTKE